MRRLRIGKIVVPHCLDTQGLDNLLMHSTRALSTIGNKNKNHELPDCYQSQDFGIWQFSECYWCKSKPKWVFYTSIVIKLETKILFRHHLNKYHTP